MTFCMTRGLLVKTAAGFTFGAVLFGTGLHLMHANVAPLQAKVKERDDKVRAILNRKYGYKKF